MTTEKFANLSQTSLASPYFIGDPTMTVQDGTKLPSAGEFHLILGPEIFVATAIAGGVVTVTGGAEGTTSINHATGDTVTAVLTKEALEKFVQRDEIDPFPIYLTEIEANALYILRGTILGPPGRDGEDADSSWIIPGPAGPSGPVGDSVVGPPGLDGEDAYVWPLPGPAGSPGVAGADGAPGAPGSQGSPGFGLPGDDGDDAWPIPGPKGDTGTAGADGAPGGGSGSTVIIQMPGDDGEQGDIGPPGQPGLQGIPGIQGNPGAQGIQGVPGPYRDGEDGDDGWPGNPGLPGQDGAAGAAGATGSQGIPGPYRDGEDGDDGWPGPPGVAGAAGTPGAGGSALQLFEYFNLV